MKILILIGVVIIAASIVEVGQTCALITQATQTYRARSQDRDCPAVGEKRVERDLVYEVPVEKVKAKHHKRRHRR